MTLTLSERCPLLRGPELSRVGRKAVLDLSGLEWVSPYDVAVLAALYTRSEERGQRPEILIPESDAVRRYMVDIGIADQIPGDWGSDAGSDNLPPLIRLLRLEDSENWDDELGELWPDVRGAVGDAELTRRLFDVLGELIDNATTHGRSEAGAFVCAQQYTGSTSELEPGIWIGVADAGIGIPRHLRRREEYSQIEADEELIRLARQQWVTGTRDHRGWGLVEVLQNIAASGIGHMMVRSGHGEGRFRVMPSARLWARYTRLKSGIPGTWVHIRIEPLQDA